MSNRVRALKCGEVVAPGPAVYLLRDFEKTYRLAVYVWLIEGGGRRILVDTGPGDLTEINRARDPGRLWCAEPITAVLDRAGVQPESIDTLVLSHLHHDHCGNAALFCDATVVLAAREWDFATNPPHPALASHPLFPKSVLEHLGSLDSRRLRLVSTGDTVAPGISLTVLGAHTPGSLAVEISAGPRNLIIAGDNFFTYRNFNETIPVGTLLNVPEWYAARDRLGASGADILPSHDIKLSVPG